MNNGAFGVFKRECVDMFCVLKTNQIMKEIESYNQRHIISFFLYALNNNLTFKTLLTDL